jgi:hypothetical protein
VWEFRDFRSRVESVITACVLFKRERENIIMRSRYDILFGKEKKKRDERNRERTYLKTRSIKKKQGTNARTCPGTPAWPFFFVVVVVVVVVVRARKQRRSVLIK